ncbi:glycosyltransferase family 4 protein [Cyclobacteriaceae bacterium]|nr:glycosyltransferase family 4 protein [Cyclobacteriaceae bacterium]
MIVCIILFLTFFIAINLYFLLAEKFNIVDVPNERSSHRDNIIRGAGVVFPVAYLLGSFYHGEWNLYFTVGLLAISLISFLDDIYTLSNKLRLSVHFSAIGLLMYSISDQVELPLWLLPLVFVVAVGIINAYNFMDGINGITSVYSLVLFGSISVVFYLQDVSYQSVLTLIAGLLVFTFYNFRSRAKCFAGDVGSVSLAFIGIYLLATLMMTTQDYSFILFLLVYGVDTIFTIIQRLYNRENIFEAHRKHLYQYFCNEFGVSHLVMSSAYGVVQLLINSLLIYNLYYNKWDSLTLSLVLILLVSAIYILTKVQLIKRIK